MTRAEQEAAMAPIKAKIKELWAEGLTRNDIAERCGITKNAVVGHIDRMKLPRRSVPVVVAREPRRDRPVPIKAVPTLAELLSPAARPPAVVAIKPVRAVARAPAPKRDAERCCWPVGDVGTKGFRWCEAEAAAGKPYCAEHCGNAYVKARPLRDEAA